MEQNQIENDSQSDEFVGEVVNHASGSLYPNVLNVFLSC